MGFWRRLISRGRASVPQTNPDEAFERLVWLEPDENPFGRRVLDCRPFAESCISATQNPLGCWFFGSPAAQTGELFRGQHPEEALIVPCVLVYQGATRLPEGALFVAPVMEDKWCIYHFEGILYFVRSWVGQLHYAARTAYAGSELRIVEIEAWPGNVIGDDQLAVRQVDFLIRTHLFNQTVPHPVPAFPNNKAVAMWSFSQYGRRGAFALPETARTSC